MKTIQEMVDIMQAYQEGKQIQIYDKMHKQWVDDEPNWNWGLQDYRIKPELKYVPFESTEEFLESQKEHGTETSTGELLFINSDNIVYIDGRSNGLGSGKCGFDCLFKNFKFADGTPCGKEVIDE